MEIRYSEKINCPCKIGEYNGKVLCELNASIENCNGLCNPIGEPLYFKASFRMRCPVTGKIIPGYLFKKKLKAITK